MSRVSYIEFVQNARKKAAPLFTLVYRPVTVPMSYALYLLGMTANTISFVGIFLAIIGGVVLLYLEPLWGLTFLLISYLFDFCDGNVARVHYVYEKRERTGASKKLGALLENLYANVSYFFFFLGLGFYLFAITGAVGYLLLGVFAYGMKIITRYSALHISLLNKGKEQKSVSEEDVESTAIFESSLLNKIKYFFVRIVDNARMYYLSFLLVFLFAETFAPAFFVGYMSFVIGINFAKLSLILIRKLP